MEHICSDLLTSQWRYNTWNTTGTNQLGPDHSCTHKISKWQSQPPLSGCLIQSRSINTAFSLVFRNQCPMIRARAIQLCEYSMPDSRVVLQQSYSKDVACVIRAFFFILSLSKPLGNRQTVNANTIKEKGGF